VWLLWSDALSGRYAVKLKRAERPAVLVVEDEPTVRSLAVSIIEDSGYSTLSASNAREAIVLLQNEPIELLLTDINLPDGPDAIDGFELAQKAVTIRPGLRVIYTTGGTRTDGVAARFVAGAILLSKPYSNAELVRAVATGDATPETSS
jgi:CheY-like chemotaxis protein